MHQQYHCENEMENIVEKIDNNVEKWVNLEDIAEHLSVSKDTIRAWMKEGKLPVYRAGKRYKFKISEVDEWVRQGRIQE